VYEANQAGGAFLHPSGDFLRALLLHYGLPAHAEQVLLWSAHLMPALQLVLADSFFTTLGAKDQEMQAKVNQLRNNLPAIQEALRQGLTRTPGDPKPWRWLSAEDKRLMDEVWPHACTLAQAKMDKDGLPGAWQGALVEEDWRKVQSNSSQEVRTLCGLAGTLEKLREEVQGALTAGLTGAERMQDWIEEVAVPDVPGECGRSGEGQGQKGGRFT
jgi:hypothetical protein